jgi:SAM-dependent methyltransferase
MVIYGGSALRGRGFGRIPATAAAKHVPRDRLGERAIYGSMPPCDGGEPDGQSAKRHRQLAAGRRSLDSPHGTRIARIRLMSSLNPLVLADGALQIGPEWTGAPVQDVETFVQRVSESPARMVTLLAGGETSVWPWVSGTSAWWEHLLLERGFRKSTLTPGTPARMQRTLDGSVIRHPVIFERLDAAALAAYPLAALKKERDLHMDMLREAGPRSDAHLARYRWACRYLPRGGAVVDAACGLGYGAAVLADAGGASRVIAIDDSGYAIEYSRLLWARTRPHATFHRGDVRTVPAADGSIDLVASMETLEHLADDGPLLEEFRRVLKPGGVLVGSVPNLWVDEHGNDPNPFHFQVFDRNRLIDVISPYFEIVELWQQNAAIDGPDGRAVPSLFHDMGLDGAGAVGKPEWLLFVARRR